MNDTIALIWPIVCGIVALVTFWISKKLFPSARSADDQAETVPPAQISEEAAKAIGASVFAAVRRDREQIADAINRQGAVLKQAANAITAVSTAIAALNERVSNLQKPTSQQPSEELRRSPKGELVRS